MANASVQQPSRYRLGTSSALAFSPMLSQSEGNLHMNLSEEQEALVYFAKEKEVGEAVGSPDKKLCVSRGTPPHHRKFILFVAVDTLAQSVKKIKDNRNVFSNTKDLLGLYQLLPHNIPPYSDM